MAAMIHTTTTTIAKRRRTTFRNGPFPYEMAENGRAAHKVAGSNLDPGQRVFAQNLASRRTPVYWTLTWDEAEAFLMQQRRDGAAASLLEIAFQGAPELNRPNDKVFAFMDVDGYEFDHSDRWSDEAWRAQSRKDWTQRLVRLVLGRLGELYDIQQLTPNDLRLATASRITTHTDGSPAFKHSFHLVCRHEDCVVEGGTGRLKVVMKRLLKGYTEWSDESVYATAQQWRMLGCHKVGGKNDRSELRAVCPATGDLIPFSIDLWREHSILGGGGNMPSTGGKLHRIAGRLQPSPSPSPSLADHEHRQPPQSHQPLISWVTQQFPNAEVTAVTTTLRDNVPHAVRLESGTGTYWCYTCRCPHDGVTPNPNNLGSRPSSKHKGCFFVTCMGRCVGKTTFFNSLKREFGVLAPKQGCGKRTGADRKQRPVVVFCALAASRRAFDEHTGQNWPWDA